jgi:hypothetical protein
VRWIVHAALQERHAKSRLDIEQFQNTLMSKRGFREGIPPSSTPNRGFPAFFSGPLCHIGSQLGFS